MPGALAVHVFDRKGKAAGQQVQLHGPLAMPLPGVLGGLSLLEGHNTVGPRFLPAVSLQVPCSRLMRAGTYPAKQ